MRYILFIGAIFFLAFPRLYGQDGYEDIRSDQTRIINGEKFFVHTVKKKQTLYSISKAYDVLMQDIINTNPELKKGLKTNQVILIPAPEPFISLPPAVDPPVLPPPVAEEEFETHKDPYGTTSMRWRDQVPCGTREDSKKEVYNVALMVHFFLDESDSINTESPTQQEIEGYNSLKYIQFYEGFMLAVDSLQKTGLNLNLFVYDVKPDPSGTYALLKQPEIEHMNLIIGMLFNRNFEIVASWARDHQIPVVSPISERESQVEGNPMVIKVRPSYTSEGIALAEYLANNFPYSHTLLTRSWEAESKRMADQIYANCKALGLDITAVDPASLTKNLTLEGENVVVVVSSQKSYVLNVLSQLNADTMGYEYTVFGLPRWDRFEGMDYQYLEKAKAHVFVPDWIDYRDPDVIRMVKKFRARYKTEPDHLAFQGYDVGWYFLNALQRYGTGFIDCLTEISMKQWQTKYKFRQMSGDGWENHHWDMFHYDNYTLSPMN